MGSPDAMARCSSTATTRTCSKRRAKSATRFDTSWKTSAITFVKMLLRRVRILVHRRHGWENGSPTMRPLRRRRLGSFAAQLSSPPLEDLTVAKEVDPLSIELDLPIDLPPCIQRAGVRPILGYCAEGCFVVPVQCPVIGDEVWQQRRTRR